jgi:hypothetical protein
VVRLEPEELDRRLVEEGRGAVYGCEWGWSHGFGPPIFHIVGQLSLFRRGLLREIPGIGHSASRLGRQGLVLPRNTTHLLGGAGIHTLSVTADGGCQPVMAMVPYFTTKQVVFYPSEPPFHRRES